MAFSSFFRGLFQLTVEEQDDLITVKNLPADFISADLQKIWATSKIGEYMFNRLSSGRMIFHKFFAPDVLYALQTISKAKRPRSNVRAINEVIEALLQKTWLKDTLTKQADILDYSQLNQLTVTMLPHQMEFFEHYNNIVPRYKLKGYMLGAAPGSGKTLTGLGLSLCVKADVVIMVVPKNAVDRVWDETIRTRFKTPQKYWTSLQNTPLKAGYKYYVCHYEYLDKMLAFAKTQKHWTNPVVILDESHNFNESSAARTENFIELCKTVEAKHVLWSSGTPIKAIGNEAIPLLTTIDPYFNPMVEARFRKIFGKSASRAIDILANRIGLVTFKIDKQVVVGNPREDFRMKCKIANGSQYTLTFIKKLMADFISERMDYYRKNMQKYVNEYMEGLQIYGLGRENDKEFQLYLKRARMIHAGYDPATMKDEVIFCNKYELKYIIPALPKQFREPFKNARSVYKYYDLKVQGEALGRILGKQRTACNVDVAKGSDKLTYENPPEGQPAETSLTEIIDFAEKKTVIFTSFVEVAQQLHSDLTKAGYKPLLVYGETNKDLPKIVADFATKIDANPLIATFQSLSTAVPLVMANTVVMMNAPFRDHEHDQSISRVDRLGQDAKVELYEIYLDTGEEANISTRSKDIMEWSREQVAAIMGRKNVDLVEALEGFTQYSNKPLQPGNDLSHLSKIDHIRTAEPVSHAGQDVKELLAFIEGEDSDLDIKVGTVSGQSLEPSWSRW